MRTIYILVGGKASPGFCSEIWEIWRATCYVGIRANQPFCQGGDSGALVPRNEGHPVDLIFVGARNCLEDLIEAVPIDGGHRRIASTSVSLISLLSRDSTSA